MKFFVIVYLCSYFLYLFLKNRYNLIELFNYQLKYIMYFNYIYVLNKSNCKILHKEKYKRIGLYLNYVFNIYYIDEQNNYHLINIGNESKNLSIFKTLKVEHYSNFYVNHYQLILNESKLEENILLYYFLISNKYFKNFKFIDKYKNLNLNFDIANKLSIVEYFLDIESLSGFLEENPNKEKIRDLLNDFINLLDKSLDLFNKKP